MRIKSTLGTERLYRNPGFVSNVSRNRSRLCSLAQKQCIAATFIFLEPWTMTLLRSCCGSAMLDYLLDSTPMWQVQPASMSPSPPRDRSSHPVPTFSMPGGRILPVYKQTQDTSLSAAVFCCIEHQQYYISIPTLKILIKRLQTHSHQNTSTTR